MFRLFFYLIALIVLISVIRSVAGVLMKGIGVWFASTSPTRPQAPSAPAGGELKKDPVCGTFVSTATSVKKSVGPSVLHFCSVECRDKFQG
jgi:YHS domain-containing protein